MSEKYSAKWFCIATEGATTDGRRIERVQIEQMAKNYNPAKYGARVWLEHLRGTLPDGPFAALGDIINLRTETREGKLSLLAQIQPLQSLVEINKAKQKIYSSVELDPKFADTGEAYLVGLGVTDSPASLGCDVLTFSSTAKVNPFSARKQKPDNLFSEAVEVNFNFDALPNEKTLSEHFNVLTDKLISIFKKENSMETETPTTPTTPFVFSDEQKKAIAEMVSESTKELQAKVEAFSVENGLLKTRLEKIESQPDPRQSDQQKFSGKVAELTDC